MFAEYNDYINPEREGSSHPLPWFSLSPDEAKVGQTSSQGHIFHNTLSKVKIFSKTQFANGKIKEELI